MASVLEMEQQSWAHHQRFEPLNPLSPTQILAQLKSVGFFSLTFSPCILPEGQISPQSSWKAFLHLY